MADCKKCGCGPSHPRAQNPRPTCKGDSGKDGKDGRGIVSIVVDPANPNQAIITYTDDTTSTIPLPPGAPGTPGAPGEDGTDGRGIDSITVGEDPTQATINYSDGTTQPLALPPGPPGADGEDGRGIDRIVAGDGANWEVVYTDGSSQMVPLPPLPTPDIRPTPDLVAEINSSAFIGTGASSELVNLAIVAVTSETGSAHKNYAVTRDWDDGWTPVAGSPNAGLSTATPETAASAAMVDYNQFDAVVTFIDTGRADATAVIAPNLPYSDQVRFPDGSTVVLIQGQATVTVRSAVRGSVATQLVFGFLASVLTDGNTGLVQQFSIAKSVLLRAINPVPTLSLVPATEETPARIAIDPVGDTNAGAWNEVALPNPSALASMDGGQGVLLIPGSLISYADLTAAMGGTQVTVPLGPVLGGSPQQSAGEYVLQVDPKDAVVTDGQVIGTVRLFKRDGVIYIQPSTEGVHAVSIDVVIHSVNSDSGEVFTDVVPVVDGFYLQNGGAQRVVIGASQWDVKIDSATEPGAMPALLAATENSYFFTRLPSIAPTDAFLRVRYTGVKLAAT